MFAWLGQVAVRHPWRASNLQDQAFPQASSVSGNAAIIVFAKAGGGKLTGADSAKIASIVQTLQARHVPDIDSITAGQPAPCPRAW